MDAIRVPAAAASRSAASTRGGGRRGPLRAARDDDGVGVRQRFEPAGDPQREAPSVRTSGVSAHTRTR